MYILLMISFVLHSVTLLVVWRLRQQLYSVNALEKKQREIIEEMDSTMATYLAEVDAQNDAFLLKVQQRMKRIQAEQPGVSITKPPSDEEGKEKLDIAYQKIDLKSEPQESFAELLQQEMTEEVERSENELTKEEASKLSRNEVQEIALSLQKKGLTIEEIAKNLYRGKTEIELLLKFQQ